MSTRAIQVRPASLVGEYGDVFWSLTPSVVYVAGTELFVRVYVANPTDVDREYMLIASVLSAGQVVSEFPITVDEMTWFTVEADNVVALPGAVRIGYTDAALTLNLYEREQNEIVDSVSTALTSAGTAGLPPLPGLPGPPPGGFDMSSIMNMMIMVMIMVMIMKMMTKAV